MNIQNMITVDNLHKDFKVGFMRKNVTAVCGIDFKVEQGEIFGLLGPNGAGKTTTLKMMMGLIFPDKGKISLMGQNARNHLARKNVGYLPESPYFHEYLTPTELLCFYGRLIGQNSSQIKKQSESLIEKVGLKDASKRPLKKFSKGMLQRIGLAQALLGDPSLLILDEPMSGLDPIGRKFVSDLIIDLNKQGKTIIFSSHILSDVERLCSRVVILNHGYKVSEGKLEDLLKSDEGRPETLESLFVRKAMETTTDNTPLAKES